MSEMKNNPDYAALDRMLQIGTNKHFFTEKTIIAGIDKLSLNNSVFRNCYLDLDIEQLNILSSSFHGCDLEDILTGNYFQCKFEGNSLCICLSLYYGCEFTADTIAVIDETKFLDCKFESVQFMENATISKAEFINCELLDIDLRKCTLGEINFSQSKLINCLFTPEQKAQKDIIWPEGYLENCDNQ